MPESSEQRGGQESPEGHQEKEVLASLLREAHDGQKLVNLVIESFGKITLIPDILVLQIEGDDLMLTYIADDGDVGEAIPVNINSIKRVEITVPWQPPAE